MKEWKTMYYYVVVTTCITQIVILRLSFWLLLRNNQVQKYIQLYKD
jgi:hypothetical protein